MNQNNIVCSLLSLAQPFQKPEDLNPLIDQIKDKKIVMLGDSSHGTSEFYQWRLEITRKLIEEHGFNFIAVEGDWPPCQEINRFVRKADMHSDPVQVLKSFSRWPTWMWGNYEMLSLMEWLSEFNQNSFSPDFIVGFHGLDVYSLFESIASIEKELDKIDPDLADKVMRYYSCFEPYQHDEKAYARSLYKYPDGCESQVAEALFEMLRKNIRNMDILQNAKIIQQAERYYRTIISGEDAWNVRDQHMMSTLDELLHHYGSESKAIVWAHNTHIGDYRGTDMLFQGEVNIGGLAREKWGEQNVALIGFATYSGSVIASHAWDGPIELMQIPPARPGSLEDYLHQCVPEKGKQFMLTFNQAEKDSPLNDYYGHRAIGVVYHPEHESRGNYVPTVLTKRYDGLIFIDETTALAPLKVEMDQHKIPETWPFGARV